MSIYVGVSICVLYSNLLSATVISPLKIQFSSEEYTAMESSHMVCINLMADRPASEPFTVPLIPMGMLSNQSASGESVAIYIFSIWF